MIQVLRRQVPGYVMLTRIKTSWIVPYSTSLDKGDLRLRGEASAAILTRHSRRTIKLFSWLAISVPILSGPLSLRDIGQHFVTFCRHVLRPLLLARAFCPGYRAPHNPRSSPHITLA